MNLWSHLLTQQYISDITKADYNRLCDILTDGFETDVEATPDGDAIKLSKWLCLLNYQQIRIGSQTMRITEMLPDNSYKTDAPLAAKGKVFLVGMGFTKIASDATSMTIASKRGHQFTLRKAARGLIEMQIGSSKRTLLSSSYNQTSMQFVGFVSDGNALYFTQYSQVALLIAYFWDDGTAFKCSVGTSDYIGSAGSTSIEEISYDGTKRKDLNATLQPNNFTSYANVYIRGAYYANSRYRTLPGLYIARFNDNFQQRQFSKIIEYLDKVAFSTDAADWEESDYSPDDFVIGYQGGYRLTRYAMLLGITKPNVHAALSSYDNGKPINNSKTIYHTVNGIYISKMRIKNLKSTDDTIFGTVCPPNTWIEFVPDLGTNYYYHGAHIEYDYIEGKPIPKQEQSSIKIFDLRKKFRWHQAIYHQEHDGISYASGNITVEGIPVNSNTIIVRHPDGDLRYDNQPSKYTIAMPNTYLNCQVDAFAPYPYCGIIKHRVVPYSTSITLRDNSKTGTALAFDQIEGQAARYAYGFSMDAGTIKIPKQSKTFAAICYHDGFSGGVSIVMLSNSKKVDTDTVRLKAAGSKIELTASKPIRCVIAGYYDDDALFAGASSKQRFQPMETIDISTNATIACDDAVAAWIESDSEIELTVNDKPYKGRHIHLPIASSLLRLQSRSDARAKLTLFRV